MKLKTFVARLDAQERERFVELAGTTQHHVVFQILGGHRGASLQLLYAFAAASRTMFPRDRRKWLSLDAMYDELADVRAARSARKMQSKRVVA